MIVNPFLEVKILITIPGILPDENATSVLICALVDPIHYLFRRAIAYFNTASLISCWG